MWAQQHICHTAGAEAGRRRATHHVESGAPVASVVVMPVQAANRLSQNLQPAISPDYPASLRNSMGGGSRENLVITSGDEGSDSESSNPGSPVPVPLMFSGVVPNGQVLYDASRGNRMKVLRTSSESPIFRDSEEDRQMILRCCCWQRRRQIGAR